MADSRQARKVKVVPDSKIFCALSIFKWVAMMLMFSIAFGEFYLKGGGEANWVFISFCIVFGFILLWIGHILAKHSIAVDQYHRQTARLKAGKHRNV